MNAVSQLYNIHEFQRSNLGKFADFAQEARKHFPRLAGGEILISPDTFENRVFDNIVANRVAELKLRVETKKTFDGKDVPFQQTAQVSRGLSEISFVTRVRFETDSACRVQLIAGCTPLQAWSLTRGCKLEQYCAFPLTGARFSEIYFDISPYDCKSGMPNVQITLIGVVFGNKDLQLFGQEGAVAEEVYDKDTILGSFPMFILRNAILCRSPYGPQSMAQDAKGAFQALVEHFDENNSAICKDAERFGLFE